MKTTIGLTLAVALFAAGVGLVGCTKGPDPAMLVGSWRLESFNPTDDFAPDPSVTTEITFKDGKVTGKGGVNRFGGSYDFGYDGTLTFGEIVSTRMAGPEVAMTQETKFFEVLGKTKRFEFNENKLILEGLNNDTLAVLVPN
ncbi:MAG TPA: META domain-containing protein [Coriobacteriia bacterium]|nr:META domain-containing protein [Coriobacteriia bacterium]